MAEKAAVLLITSAGLVGSNLAAAFRKQGVEPVRTYYPGIDEAAGLPVDIADAGSVERLFAQTRPATAVLSAALTNVDFCEEHPDQARRINVEGVRNVAGACKTHGSKLVFFSSDYVFDGKSGPYSEEDTAHPVCVYGRTKLEAEELIRAGLDDHLIIRTTGVFGFEKLGKNFVYRLINTVRSGQQIRVPRDQVGSPTYAANLAEIVLDLAAQNKKGVYNVVGCDRMDRHAFALAVCAEFGLDAKSIIPVTTAALQQKAPRPLNAGLKIDKIVRESTVSPISVREGLARFKKEFYG